MKAGLAFIATRAAEGLRGAEEPPRQKDEAKDTKDRRREANRKAQGRKDDEGRRAGRAGRRRRHDGRRDSRRGEDETTQKKLLPVTPWGRYVKILLSSNEFLFIELRTYGAFTDHDNPITRREALCRIGNGFGMMAFAGLVSDSVARAADVAAAITPANAPSASSSCS